MSIWNTLGLNFLNGLIDYGFSSAQQKRQNQFNAEEAQKARDFNAEEAEKQRDWSTSEREATQDWNLDQWNRENEYNSPKAQMQRMLDAGINPNSAINQLSNVAGGSVRSSAGSGASASGPSASSVGMISSNFQGMLGNYFQNRVLASQAGLLDAQTKGQEEENKFIHPLRLQEWMTNNDNAKYIRQMTRTQEKLNEKYGVDIDFQKGNLDYSQSEWQYLKKMFDLQLTEQGLVNTNLEKTGKEIDERIETQDAQQANLNANTNKTNLEAGLLSAKLRFAQSGIVCDDSTATIFAKCEELIAQGKIKEANDLKERYFNMFKRFSTDTTPRTWQHSLGSFLDRNILPELNSYVDFTKGLRSGLWNSLGLPNFGNYNQSDYNNLFRRKRGATGSW